MAHYQLVYKAPEIDLRLKFRRIFETALLVSLILSALLFYAFRTQTHHAQLDEDLSLPPLTGLDVPITEYHKQPPPPARPSIPVASEDPSIPDQLTIATTGLNFSEPIEMVKPQVAEQEPPVPFYALSKPPVAIHKVQPKYPDMARKAGVEGQVVIKVLIDTKGNVEDALILKSSPLFDKEALTAARQFIFTPGEQRNRPVRVWMSIPFNFRLRN